MKLDYDPTGMPPHFNLYQLEEVLGVSIPYIKQIMFVNGIDYWYNDEGMVCYDSEQAYKKVILQPAKLIFGMYLYAKLTHKKEKYSITKDMEDRLKDIRGDTYD